MEFIDPKVVTGVLFTINSEVVLVNILNFDQNIVECCIEVGYLSKNTHENALETRYWALEKKIKSIYKYFIQKLHISYRN